jgi:peptidoglycan hydrolase-like protein with peptidoglycan-binding domain
MRVLSDDIALRGIIRAGQIVGVTASAPYATVVVTKMPVRLGARVRPGHVIAEIDGRPVVLLRGSLPAYRDLHEGESGPDVAQLQAALQHLGYADYDRSGYFGPSTALALASFYQHLGYPVPRYRRRVSKPVKFPLPQTPYLPMSEVSYIPAGSALVVSVAARVGTKVTAGHLVLRLAVGRPQVTGVLSADQAARARAGMAARIALPGSIVAGVVTRIGTIPAGRKGQAQYPVWVTSTRPLPQRAIGSAVRLTLRAPVTRHSRLTVPLTAVFSAPSRPGTRPGGGRSVFVVLVTASGRRTRVPVLTGPTAGGFVAIRPTVRGALRPGDRVLIGVGR